MALTTLLVAVSLVTIASAGFPGWADDDNFPGFGPPLMSLRLASPPSFPKFPQVPNPLLFFNFPPFPTMPKIKFPPMPSPEDMATAKPPAGGTFNGVMVSSQSEAKVNEDGTVTKKGGSTIMVNDNGKVTVEKTGDSPPEVATSGSSFGFNMPKIKPFKPFKFKPLNTDTIKNFVPQKGQEYKGSSVSKSTYYKSVNGVSEEGGSVSSVVNDNGKVKTEQAVYHKGDPPKDCE